MKIEVHVHKDCDGDDDRIRELSERVASLSVAVIDLKGAMIMEFKDVQDALDRVDAATSKIGTDVTAMAEDVTTVVAKEAEQLAEIQALKDQIAAGSPVTQEQLDALATRSQAAAQTLEGVSTALSTAASTLDSIASNPAEPIPGEGEGGEGGEGTGGEGGESGESGAGSEGSGSPAAAEGEAAPRNLSTARPADASRKGGVKS